MQLAISFVSNVIGFNYQKEEAKGGHNAKGKETNQQKRIQD